MALFSGIAALAGMAGTWTLFGSATLFTLAKTAVGIGLNTLAARLSGRKASAPSFSVKGQLQRGADLPQSFLIGRCATAGSLVYANSWGRVGNAPNGWLTMVITLSDLPVQSLDGLWVDGQKCTFGDEHPDYGFSVNEYKEGDNQKDHLWIKFYDGSQTVADPYLVNTASTQQRPWEADAVGYGTAYAIVTARIDQDLFQGFPECLFELTGARLYDPSKDSTVGGTGPQRWSDPSTWGGDGDHLPAVQLYNLFRGLWWGGEWFYGMQATHAAQMPVAHWIDQIEKCRAPIVGANGPEPTYRAGGEISVGAPIAQAMDALLETCSGRVSEAGGLYKLFVGGLSAPVVSITDDDILSSEEQTFTPFFGLADTVNGVSGKFPDPAQVWQLESAPPLNNPDFEVEDGGRRLMVDVQYDLAPYSEQVQRLMQGGLNEARRARRHTFVLPPRFWALEAGDIVSFTSERNGYVAKLFRVDGVLDQSNADVLVDLTEVDPADYVFDTNTDYTPVTGGSVVAPVVPPQPIAGWSVTAAASTDAQGAGRFPAIAVGWDGDMDDVIAVEVRARVKATGAMIFSGRFEDVAAAAGLIVAGILPAATYEVQGRYVPGTARQTVWSDWLEVTTLDLRITRDQLHDEIGASLDQAEQGLVQLSQEIDAAAYQALQVGNEIDALLAGFAGGTLQGALDTQQSALQANIDNLSATLTQGYYTAAQADRAIAASKTALRSEIASESGSVLKSDFFKSGTYINWVTGPTVTANEQFEVGNTLSWNVNDTTNAGLRYSSKYNSHWKSSGMKNADAYEVEVVFELVSGSLGGAGVLFDWRDVNNALKRTAVPLNRYVERSLAAIPGKIYTAKILMERPEWNLAAFSYNSIYLMANYGAVGDGLGRSAKHIKFHKFSASPVSSIHAEVTEQRGSIAALEGSARAAYVLRAAAGGSAADFEMVAWDDADGNDAGSLIRLNADNIIAKGTLSTDKLTVGIPTQNMIPDPMFLNPDLFNSNWVSGGVTASYRSAGGWRPSHGPSLQLYSPVTGDKAGGLFGNVYFYPVLGEKFPVKAGSLYELSMQFSVHRATGQMVVEWYDEDGNWLTWTRFANLGVPGQTSYWGGTSSSKSATDAWPRFGKIAKAPAGAAFARPRVEMSGVHGSSTTSTGYIIGHSPVFRQAFSLDEPLSSIDTRGVTHIDGGNVIAETITSQQIDTLEFRSAGLATFGGAIMSANFDGTVDAAGNLLTRGTQGFAITQKGDAVFTNLIARDDIQVGAVSAGVTYASSGAQTLPINAEVFRYSLGAFLPGEFWNIACAATWRSYGTRAEYGGDEWHRRQYYTGVRLQLRQRSGASWSRWDTIHTFSQTRDTSWRTDDVVVTKLGAFDEVEVRAVVYGYLGPRFPSGSPTGSIIPNVKDVSLYARAIVR